MESKLKKFYLAATSLYIFPQLVFAAFPSTLGGVINMFTEIGLKLVPFFGAVAFLVFVWGVAKFIRSAGSEKDLKDSKNLLIWGIIGMFVLATAWGLIYFLQGEFGFRTGDKPIIPLIPTKF